MKDRSLSQAWPDDWNGGVYAAIEPRNGADPSGAASVDAHDVADTRPVRPDAGHPGALRPSAARDTADATGFLGALFDLGFTSFMTPRIIKVLYVLLMIGAVVSVLAVTIVVFKVSATFGIVTLVFADPLVILIVMAICRMILEYLVVTFRLADDIQRLRERGDLG
ncbi:MAG TPA: DUF4282 domain-containing protein [Streptosporangiaceae bacterium]|jgi:hypothetical protein|nr:DUF4282 domain-containing protein [Streptosporangiaceae bacterium]